GRTFGAACRYLDRDQLNEHKSMPGFALCEARHTLFVDDQPSSESLSCLTGAAGRTSSLKSRASSTSHAMPVYRATRVAGLSASSTTTKTMKTNAIHAATVPPGTAYSRATAGPRPAEASLRRIARYEVRIMIQTHTVAKVAIDAMMVNSASGNRALSTTPT